ncbi:MAG: hypothetical protein GY859_27850, partial [Desulfobacterales bacterium]|nr:hypothetical protein [Desulfobacterales bacterium]
WIVAERLSFIRARFDAGPGIKSADHSFSTMDPEGWEVCKEAMKRLHRACRTRGVQTLFLIHPGLSPPSRFRQRAAHEEFARFCEREGIAYMDLRDALGDRDPTSLRVSGINHHANPEGNRLIAVAISGWIKEWAGRETSTSH